MKRGTALLRLSTVLGLLGLAACGGSGEDARDVGIGLETTIPARRAAVLLDGCVMDTWSRTSLAQPATRRLVSEVVLLCLVPRESGEVGPRDASARAALGTLVSDLKKDGYTVTLGVAFTDESGQRYDGAQTRAWLARPDFRERLRETLVDVSSLADGVEIDLQKLPNDARRDVTDVVGLVADALHARVPRKSVGVFVPPSVARPSDLPGGEAFDRAALAARVDRLRVMTLDYSETEAGPTIDPGWAADAARLARQDAPSVDLAYPLYGIDFGPRGQRSVTWFEANAAFGDARATGRGPTNAPFVRYVRDGEAHALWYDDAISTGTALAAWSYDVLPPDIGVLFYGLGAEDPTLFARLAARLP